MPEQIYEMTLPYISKAVVQKRKQTSKKSDESTNDVRQQTNLKIGELIIRCLSISTGTSL